MKIPILIISTLTLIMMQASIIFAINLPPCHKLNSKEEAIKLKKEKLNLKTIISYMNKGRDTGDVYYYDLAEKLLKRLIQEDPANYKTIKLEAWVQTKNNQFNDALVSAKEAIQLNPNDSLNYWVIVDTLIELGRYEEAREIAEVMVDVESESAAYSRVAYLNWLYGRHTEAKKMLNNAIEVGSRDKLEKAWNIVQLGNFYFNQGKLKLAEKQYLRARKISPGYIHTLAGLGKIKAAQGDYSGAIKLFKKVTLKTLNLDYMATLADLYYLSGNQKKADKQYYLTKFVAQKQPYSEKDKEKIATFYLHIDEDLVTALKYAEQNIKVKDDFKAWNLLAWAYYKNHQYKKADLAMKKALQWGTKDSMLFYHAAMIKKSLGEKKLAKKYLLKARSLNPYFDLKYSRLAHSELSNLQIKQGLALVNKIKIIPILLILLLIIIYLFFRKILKRPYKGLHYKESLPRSLS